MRRNPAPPVCALTLVIAPAVAELTPFSANPRFRSLNGESCRVGIVELKVHLKALGNDLKTNPRNDDSWVLMK